MKLLFCPSCQDVLKLSLEGRHCECGASWGRYLEDGLEAELSGEGIPLGFANSTFRNALGKRPAEGLGATFTAFVIAEFCETVDYVAHRDRA